MTLQLLWNRERSGRGGDYLGEEKISMGILSARTRPWDRIMVQELVQVLLVAQRAKERVSPSTLDLPIQNLLLDNQATRVVVQLARRREAHWAGLKARCERSVRKRKPRKNEPRVPQLQLIILRAEERAWISGGKRIQNG
jgi:hypothetical protein